MPGVQAAGSWSLGRRDANVRNICMPNVFAKL
jgi:hypothetical protein